MNQTSHPAVEDTSRHPGRQKEDTDPMASICRKHVVSGKAAHERRANWVVVLANSNGAILEMLDEKNPVVYTNGGRRYKMFQFLSDVVGLNAFRAHIWKTIGIGSAVRTKEGFDRGFYTAFPQAGSQGELFEVLEA